MTTDGGFAGDDSGNDFLLTAEAFVSTEHADRYLARLSRHASQMYRHFGDRPHARHEDGEAPRIGGVETSETEAVLTFADGRCLVWARSDGLRLRVEANNDKGLRRVQDGIAGRLETLGSRDGLKVAWGVSTDQ